MQESYAGHPAMQPNTRILSQNQIAGPRCATRSFFGTCVCASTFASWRLMPGPKSTAAALSVSPAARKKSFAGLCCDHPCGTPTSERTIRGGVQAQTRHHALLKQKENGSTHRMPTNKSGLPVDQRMQLAARGKPLACSLKAKEGQLVSGLVT